MVDAGDYIEGRSVRFDLLASTLLTSLLLQLWAGAALTIEEWARVPATVIGELFAWAAYVLTTALAQPTQSLYTAWGVATRALPDVGPLTIVVGLAVVALTWYAQGWVIDRIREGAA